MEKTIKYLQEWLLDVYKWFGGLAMSLVSFFMPIKNIVLFVTVLFILDVVFGYWRALKFRKEAFKPKIIWEKTMPRWLISVLLLSLLFAWDEVHHQHFVGSYYVAGYFISGMIIVSIMENALKITDWKILKGLKSIIETNIEKNTGEIVKEDESDIK